MAFPNMRSNHFQKIRADFSSSDSKDHIFLGKLTLLQLALGRTVEDEYAENLHHFSKFLKGSDVGLLLTSRPHAEVQAYFDGMVAQDYPRAGATAPVEVIVKNEQLEHFPASMLESLRKLGMPVEMLKGKIVLQPQCVEDGWRLCRSGEVLTAEKCKLLTQLEQKLAEFRVKLVCRWHDGEFEEL
jgi:mRNA turnover protein 4